MKKLLLVSCFLFVLAGCGHKTQPTTEKPVEEVKKEVTAKEEVVKEEIKKEVVKPKTEEVIENSNEKVWFEVKELGVKFLIDKNLANNLVYKVVKNENFYGVNFSTKELNSKGGLCETELVRMLKNNGKYNSSNEPLIDQKLIKQFDSFYIYVVLPQVSCFDTQINMSDEERKENYKKEVEVLDLVKESIQSMVKI